MNFIDIINKAKAMDCSDVHITVGTPIAFRRYGKLMIQQPAPTADEARELILTGLLADQYDQLSEGKDLDFALFLPDGTRLRANIYRQRNNLAASYRLLKSTIPSYDELGIPEAVRKMVNEPGGLVLITGPTGSGKTTTLASMVDFINKKMDKHIMTIEDPIEYVYAYSKSMIHQREVGRDVPDFHTALRSALREDPDIILVGEMRDLETINSAITAAETGHLVLSTLHTTSASQTIERIIDAYPPHGQSQARSQLAQVLCGVCSQVLLPRADGNGMIMATEVLVNNDAVANQIREGKTHLIPSTIQSGVKEGMHLLSSDISRLLSSRIISEQTARKYKV